MSWDDQAQEARATLEAAAVELLKAGERRGRGQAAAAEVPDLYRVARACPDTLAGTRDKALVLTGFHYTSRAQADAKVNYQQDPEACRAEAWEVYRARLTTEAGPRWSPPEAPAFVGVDRHGNVTGGMVPDSVTRAVKRTSVRAGIPLAWTGHTLRIGLATTARKKGKDAVAIADQDNATAGLT